MTLLLNPKEFTQLSISEGLKKSLALNGFTKMKPIQTQAIPHLLAGRNLLGASPTGSGKTLAFLIPAIEMLTYSRTRPAHGTVVVVLSPSRELALQTFNVASNLMKSLSPTVFPVIGGQTSFKDEAYQLTKRGANLLIATPGRLRQHLEAGNINHTNFKFLVIDEADRMLEDGFADDLYHIFSTLPRPLQTALFSATLTRDVEGLIKVHINSPPVFCCPFEKTTVDSLEHFYGVTPLADRLGYLVAFLSKLKNKKSVVFVSSRKEAEFIDRLLNALDFESIALHGDLQQEERNLAFVKFNRGEKNILVSTNVGSRGLDFPDVHWSISVGFPKNVKEYVHRAGRTARNEKEGRSLVFVAPGEDTMIEEVKKDGIEIAKVAISTEGLEEAKERIRNAVSKSEAFMMMAEDAADAFENSYKSGQIGGGDIELDMNGLRESFGIVD